MRDFQKDGLQQPIEQGAHGFTVAQLENIEELLDFAPHFLQHLDELAFARAVHHQPEVVVVLHLRENREQVAGVG